MSLLNHMKHSFTYYEKTNDAVHKALQGIGGLLIFLFLAGVFTDVTVRIFGYSIDWMQEITTFIFIWACFLGVPAVFRKGHLYTIDLIPKSIPPRIQWVLRGVVLILTACFIWYFLYYGIQLSLMGIHRTSQPSNVRIVYAFAAIPVSGFLFLLFYIETLIHWCTSKPS